jgi:hypothetical protein
MIIILTTFNNHFAEFVDDVYSIFPTNVDVLTAKNSLLTIRKANPKIIIKIWKVYIGDKYSKEIEASDIRFFVNKDYLTDLSDSQNSDKIMEGINRLRDPISQMGPENQAKTMQYIQNLTRLANLYEQ